MSAVYICTKDRFGNLVKVVPRWMTFQYPIVLVVDRDDAIDTQSLIRREGWESRVRVQRLRENNRGIGYARRAAVRHAESNGHQTIIMADDDIMPRAGTDLYRLFNQAHRPDTLGIGATHSQHDLLTGGFTKTSDMPILCPSGYGFQLFGLNVRNAIAVGSFDVQLDVFGEDAELMRHGIVAGFPWKLHCGVKCQKIGKRGDPGGIESLTRGDRYSDRRESEIWCQEHIHRRWPEYTSEPPKPSRMAWQKFYNHYMPDWRKLSAIHGGSL
jgi:glycosyltransferase involved in cell wall biosynthesis